MGKSVEYYLARGFTPKMAEYYSSGRKKITAVRPNDDYTLTLTFDNGELRKYDIAPLVQGSAVFSHLLNQDVFQRVYLDDAHCVAWDIDPNIDSNLDWNNKVDLCPDCCYVDSIPISNDC